MMKELPCACEACVSFDIYQLVNCPYKCVTGWYGYLEGGQAHVAFLEEEPKPKDQPLKVGLWLKLIGAFFNLKA